MRTLVAWRGGLFLTEGKIGVLPVSSLFLMQVGVYVGVCVYIRASVAQLVRARDCQSLGRRFDSV